MCRTLRNATLCVLLLLTVTLEASAASRREVLNRLESFRQFFVDFQYAPDSAIPGDLLSECHGIIIMRHYKAGFILGARGGDGVVFLRDPVTREWSPPGFIVSGEGSFGFQIGGQAIDAIMLIMNRSGVNMLLKSRFQVGVDASAAAGPVGRDASAKVGPGTAILAYSRAKGLYAGVAFEGGALLNYDKFNHALYGMKVGLKDILIDQIVPFPPEALSMTDTLNSYMTVQSAPTSPYATQPGTARSATPVAAPSTPTPAIQPAPAPPPPELEPSAPPPVDAETAARLAIEARAAADSAEAAAQAAEAAARAAKPAGKY